MGQNYYIFYNNLVPFIFSVGVIGFIILIFLKSSWQNLLFFFIYNSSIKLLPILILSNFTIKLKDIVFGVYFYLLYLFHMIIIKI